MLLVGAFRYGFGNWEVIAKDPKLGLTDKFFLEEGKKGEDASTKPIHECHSPRATRRLPFGPFTGPRGETPFIRDFSPDEGNSCGHPSHRRPLPRLHKVGAPNGEPRAKPLPRSRTPARGSGQHN